MFETLDRLADPDPPAPDRAAVERRARRLRQRRRMTWLGAGSFTVVAVVLLAAMAWPDDHQPVRVVDVPTTTVPKGLVSPGEAVERCFDLNGADPVPPTGSPVPIDGWPEGAPALLALTNGGNLWVLADGAATVWTSDETEGAGISGLTWAQWGPDGSIYASRLIDSPEIVVERFTAPGVAEVAFTLPFIVDQAVTDGCPIDGYLESFAVSDLYGITVLGLDSDGLAQRWTLELRMFDALGEPGQRWAEPVATRAAGEAAPEVRIAADSSSGALLAGVTVDEEVVHTYRLEDAARTTASPSGSVAVPPDSAEIYVADGGQIHGVSDVDGSRRLIADVAATGPMAATHDWLAVQTADGLVLVDLRDGTPHPLGLGLLATGTFRTLDWD